MAAPKSLKRSMLTLGALLITLSSITPASSVFIIAPSVIQQAGTGAFLSFVFAAFIGVFTAFVYGEMSSAFPCAGGEYSIVGHVMGPAWGLITLGTNLISAILMLAALSVGMSVYLQPIFPNADPTITGMIALAITTLFGLLNIRTNAIVTGFFLCLELVALVVLAWLGFAHTERPLTEIMFHPVLLGGNSALVTASFGAIGLAAAVAISAYNGYGQAVYLGEEIHDAPKRIAPAILWALAITVVAEAVPVTAALLGAPDLQSFLGSPTMLSDFVTLRGGPQLNVVVDLCVTLAIFNANIAFIILIARILFSTGRDHIWTSKINHGLTSLNRFHSPWIATLLCGSLGVLACLIKQDLLLVITGTGFLVVYSLLTIASIVGRRNKRTAHASYKMPFYPLTPIVALMMMGYILYANFLDPDVGRPSLVATVVMVVLSGLYYLLYLRNRKGWSLKVPPLK